MTTIKLLLFSCPESSSLTFSVTVSTLFSFTMQVFHSEKVLMKRTWREAEAFCEEFGAHLASFAHIEEENFVNELLHSKFNR